MCQFCAGALLLIAAAGGAQPLFTDVTEQVGVPPFAARSLAFGDYDNDGWPDLFAAPAVVSPIRSVALLHNEGERGFADNTGAIGSAIANVAKGGGSIFGDYDNDGDLDLYVTIGGWESRGLDLLLRNDRGRFEDVAAAAGLADNAGSDNAIWLDYDGDGYLDLYVGHQSGEQGNSLYRNLGDGTFADRTAAVGLDVDFGTTGGLNRGSNGGLAAADFDGDGWPDLYVGVYENRNRLFLNDRSGRFVENTTAEVGDRGQAHGVAVGDLNGDGLPEIFQAAGGGEGQERSVLLLNLGAGQFLDVTESAGLAALTATVSAAPGLVDLDGDGDLDLLVGDPTTVFLNDGDLILTHATALAGLGGTGGALAVGDIDLDGYPDLWFGSGRHWEGPGRVYRHNGHTNRLLGVRLVGTASDRDGIGARLTAVVNGRRQVRDITGGLGYQQDEPVARFGLGQHTRVDTLIVEWPSGQVDVLLDLEAGGTVRVVEGMGAQYPVPSTLDVGDLPGVVAAGSEVTVDLRVRPAPVEPGAGITRVSADLSQVGGPSEVVLSDMGDGSYAYHGRHTAVGPSRYVRVSAIVEQITSLGPRWSRLSRALLVAPPHDLVLYGDDLATGWRVQPAARTLIDLHAPTASVGDHAAGVSITVAGELALIPPGPLPTIGYTDLRFSLHPGDVDLTRVILTVRSQAGWIREVLLGDGIDNPAIDNADRTWQQVVVPLSACGHCVIDQIALSTTGTGTLYLDDIRLVTAAHGLEPTAVVESWQDATPESFSLAQNHPNPFNPETTIRFDLPRSAEVELAVYNLAAQKVATLAQGRRQAGSYSSRWDGRDDVGRELASGVYLYRLIAGDQVGTRKLLLLR